MNKKLYKVNLDFMGYIEAINPEEVDSIITNYFRSWREFEEIDTQNMLIDEVLPDEE